MKGVQIGHEAYITVLVPIVFLDTIDDLVRDGLYHSRSEAIRSAIRSSFIEGELSEKLKTFQKNNP